MVMCAQCWHQVPRDIQAHVWSSWRLVQGTTYRDSALYLKRIRIYRAAVDAAVLSVRA